MGSSYRTSSFARLSRPYSVAPNLQASHPLVLLTPVSPPQAGWGRLLRSPEHSSSRVPRSEHPTPPPGVGTPCAGSVGSNRTASARWGATGEQQLRGLGSATVAPARRAARGRGLKWKLRADVRVGAQRTCGNPRVGWAGGGRPARLGPAKTRAARAARWPCKSGSTCAATPLRTANPTCPSALETGARNASILRFLLRKTCETQKNPGHFLHCCSQRRGQLLASNRPSVNIA